MAKKTGASQHISPRGKGLGLKVGSGEKVNPGEVLVRQIGTQIKAGTNVKMGRDFTLYAVAAGVVKFGRKIGKKFISVISSA